MAGCQAALLLRVPLIGKYHRRPAIPTTPLVQATQGRKIHMRPRDHHVLARDPRQQLIPRRRSRSLVAACALFHFPYHPYLSFLQRLPHSLPKDPGVPPPVQPIPPKRVTHTRQFLGPPSLLPPVTNHQSGSPLQPICRLRRCSPLRDTGTSASVASESATRLRND